MILWSPFSKQLAAPPSNRCSVKRHQPESVDVTAPILGVLDLRLARGRGVLVCQLERATGSLQRVECGARVGSGNCAGLIVVFLVMVVQAVPPVCCSGAFMLSGFDAMPGKFRERPLGYNAPLGKSLWWRGG